jgi:uncharacterized protein YecT (DUF1311 family)
MKTRKYLLVAILPLILLVSCHQNDTFVKQHNRDETLKGSLEVEYNYTVVGNTPDEFPILISSNPIDLKYKEFYEDYDGSSQMISKIESKYKDWWYTEMEVAYNQLLKLLDENDRQSLINSQISWESYMENKKNIEENFFYQNKYDSVGELRKALIIAEEAEETKERAYSLLEYLYIITGEINMVFSSEK